MVSIAVIAVIMIVIAVIIIIIIIISDWPRSGSKRQDRSSLEPELDSETALAPPCGGPPVIDERGHVRLSSRCGIRRH